MPRVSVIIPNYNRANLIGVTLENMLSQTLKPIEIIVVDDGSTDNSVDVIRSFGSKVTLISQANQGPGAARNAGLKVATGDYVQFFDSDDLCSLNKLECQAKALESSDADIAYSPWVKVYIDNQKMRCENHVIQQRQLPRNIHPLRCFLRGWSIIFQSCMLRRSFIKQVGNYRTDLMPSEDSEFLFRMLVQNAKLQFVPECLVLYRLHSMGQITASGTTKNYRIIDWANFQKLVKSQLLESQVNVDAFTQIIFEAGVYKALRDLKSVQEEIPLAKNKDSDYPPSVEPIYKAVNFYKRIEAGLRGRITGARYSHLYQTSYPTEYQYQLIQNMGYEPVSQFIRPLA